MATRTGPTPLTDVDFVFGDVNADYVSQSPHLCPFLVNSSSPNGSCDGSGSKNERLATTLIDGLSGLLFDRSTSRESMSVAPNTDSHGMPSYMPWVHTRI